MNASYDALVDVFECIENFLRRLMIYTKIGPTPALTTVVVNIMVELLSVFALATAQIRQGRFSECSLDDNLPKLKASQGNI
jgi:hypothetical protein